MTIKKTAHVSDAKKKLVKELSELIKNKKTILIASIKNLPASQFQEIGKKLRSKAVIKVPKKNLIFKAIDLSENEEVKKLRQVSDRNRLKAEPLAHSSSISQMKEQIKENVAVLFSEMDCFELAEELIKNKSPSKAKAGQEAIEDIEVQAGPTDLVPGPAISELGAVGIQIQIEKGKINIKESKVIVKKGEKISSAAVGIMDKLGIKPFSIGFIPLCAFDTQEKKLYLNIKIDKKGTLEGLKSAFGKALSFAVEIGYTCEDTIKFLIRKAGVHEKALKNLIQEKNENQTPEVNSEGGN